MANPTKQSNTRSAVLTPTPDALFRTLFCLKLHSVQLLVEPQRIFGHPLLDDLAVVNPIDGHPFHLDFFTSGFDSLKRSLMGSRDGEPERDFVTFRDQVLHPVGEVGERLVPVREELLEVVQTVGLRAV